MTETLRCVRPVAVVTLAAFIAACSHGVPVHSQDAIKQGEFYDDTMRLRLWSGKQIKARAMTVSDSTVTVHEVDKRFGTETLDPPLVIPLSEIEAIERMEFDKAGTLSIVVFAAVLVFIFTGFGLFDGFGL